MFTEKQEQDLIRFLDWRKKQTNLNNVQRQKDAIRLSLQAEGTWDQANPPQVWKDLDAQENTLQTDCGNAFKTFQEEIIKEEIE